MSHVKSKSTKSVGSYDSMFIILKNGIEINDVEGWFRDSRMWYQSQYLIKMRIEKLCFLLNKQINKLK